MTRQSSFGADIDEIVDQGVLSLKVVAARGVDEALATAKPAAIATAMLELTTRAHLHHHA